MITTAGAGRGPGYDPARDLAWWFDIERNRLFTRKIGGGETEVHELPFSASAMAVTTDGRQLMLAENGLTCVIRGPAR
ncbi:hypothetical protein [Gemmobacter sp. 24YEA27]|uniref:hypothetical protein n=1 Tax=Gemmobacter sp. 24YEA27 TaxID=3040672 RepID=UPI0024B39052|nr:hypothetical protein [Gemmobacter sp. 24YEA27]